MRRARVLLQQPTCKNGLTVCVCVCVRACVIVSVSSASSAARFGMDTWFTFLTVSSSSSSPSYWCWHQRCGILLSCVSLAKIIAGVSHPSLDFSTHCFLGTLRCFNSHTYPHPPRTVNMPYAMLCKHSLNHFLGLFQVPRDEVQKQREARALAIVDW